MCPTQAKGLVVAGELSLYIYQLLATSLSAAVESIGQAKVLLFSFSGCLGEPDWQLYQYTPFLPFAWEVNK